MGNANPTLSKSNLDYGNAVMKGKPILFHRVHSENVQLSVDQRRAKRVESFCKGIAFSDRTIGVNERVYLSFAEVSTSWSGVVRLGFTSHDPLTINAPELPRYACPDLTYKPGYWAKALPERYAEEGITLYYYLTRSGDVYFGINGEEKGLFFSGVATNCNLWGLVDIYGNTTCMEFVDGWQLNNMDSSNKNSMSDLVQSLALSDPSTPPPAIPSTPQSPPPLLLPPTPSTTGGAEKLNKTVAGLGSMTVPPLRYHLEETFLPMPFHHTMGRNVCLSSDRTLAVRLVEEYCNGYVFTNRPLKCGEQIVIQILSVDKEYTGGLAFGMTSCDPITIIPDELPDDSDLLLDRPEYWVVNKDVCMAPEFGDELSFSLTSEGEVRYGKNGHYITTLMFIDKTLPMWAFFDVYGNTQKIQSVGVTTPEGTGSVAGLTVALPPPRSQSSPSATATKNSSITPPPRPPPPRASPSSSSDPSSPPPSLPPKHLRPGSTAGSPVHPAALMKSARLAGSPLPAPLMPTPAGHAPVLPERQTFRQLSPSKASGHHKLVPRGSKGGSSSGLRPAPRPLAPPVSTPSYNMSAEAMDNETNECKVCMNNPVDCVIYTCGHMCICYQCAQDIRNKDNLCPICRQDIKDIIRFYRS